MLIAHHHELLQAHAPGWRVGRLAGAEHAGGGFEVWRLALDSGMASPWATSVGCEVVLVLAGSGKLRLPSGPYRFSAPCTLSMGPHTQYQFVNLGVQELHLVAVRATAGESRVSSSPEDPAAGVAST